MNKRGSGVSGSFRYNFSKQNCEPVTPSPRSPSPLPNTLSALHSALDSDSVLSPEGHVISGPMVGGVRKRKQQSSPLALAFQNAWKQGTLASDVSYSRGHVMITYTCSHSYWSHDNNMFTCTGYMAITYSFT